MITNETPRRQSVAETFSQGQKLAEIFTLKQRLPAIAAGDVWLAHDAEQDKAVALLFLPDALLTESHVLDELRAQVKLNRQLIHPHVLRTHDFIEESGWAAISSDGVEAETLASLLAKKESGCFEASEIKPWITTICQTLDDAHRANLLHRDLSIENILITKSGDLLIANFGISRIILDALSRAQPPANTDEHLGYMSPQQLDGEYPARWDDVYSLGILIYHLLTGKPPFYSGDLVPQIRKDIPPSISDRRTEFGITGEPVPPNWEKVVAACLDKHTPPRPKSAREAGVKLGAEISMAQSTVRAPAPVEALPGRKEARETPVEDILWAKAPKPQTAAKLPVPAAPKSLGHLLEKIPDEQGRRPGFPIGTVIMGIFAGVAAIAVVIVAGSHILKSLHNSQQPSQKIALTAASSPTPAAVVPKPTSSGTPFVVLQPSASASPVSQPSATPREIVKVDNFKLPVIVMPPPGVSTPKIEEIRKAIGESVTGLQAQAKTTQQAETEAMEAQKILDDKLAALAVLKKAADDAAALSKQSEDAEQKAAADAADAEKTATEKARIADEAKKAADQVASQFKDQDDARQRADVEVQELQKAADVKQQAAIDAAKARKDVEDRVQQQQLALNQAVASALQQSMAAASPSPAPAATASTSPPPGATTGVAPVTPEKSAASIEEAEKMVLNQITQQKQTKAEVTPPAVTVPVIYVPNPKSQIDKTMVNSLGMKFAPVGNVLFCIWPVRFQDFEAFATETNFKGYSWREPGFKQGPDHPVVNVTWQDAMAFCKWLTDKEQKAGLLAPNQAYRLPTDMEWSKAVGLPEETGRTPEMRDMDVPDVYPWGTQWPPPAGAGNYTGEETGSDVAIKGYDDGYAWTSPVGTFAANRYGLYDMGGNVWQWCMDWWNSEQKAKVLRGASWYNGGLKLSLLSSCRLQSAPDISTDNYGFRCVIAPETKPKR